MQPKEAVEINRSFSAAPARLWNSNRRPHPIVVGLGERNDGIQAVGGPALEEHYELLLPCRGRHGDCTLQKRGHGTEAYQRDATLLHEEAA